MKRFQPSDVININDLTVLKVGDAISDLPAFEYDEPAEVPKDERGRSGAHKGTFCLLQGCGYVSINMGMSTTGKWIGSEVREYTSEPTSDFQKAMRRQVKNNKLYNHVTKTFTDMNVKRICQVPKRYSLLAYIQSTSPHAYSDPGRPKGSRTQTLSPITTIVICPRNCLRGVFLIPTPKVRGCCITRPNPSSR